MTTKHGAVISSAWDSGIDFHAERPERRHSRVQPRRTVNDVAATVTIPRTKRGSPPPLEDDIDLLGGLLLVLFFLAAVWL